MDIVLYNTASDNREIHKKLNSERRITGQLMEGTSVITPSILIDMQNINNLNYAYIPAFGRYYYITNINAVEGERLTIDLSTDVLMSFWDDFKNSQVIAERSSSKYNQYLSDNKVAFTSNVRYEYRRLPFTFTPTESGNNYVLTMGGKI